MRRPTLSATATGQQWIAQFGSADHEAAATMLNTMLLLNEEQVATAIRGLLHDLAKERQGFRRRVGLYAEREFAEAAAFKTELVSDRNGRLRKRAVGRAGPAAVRPKRGSSRVGSEGFIASIISQAVEAWPRIYSNQPGPDRIRTKQPIGALVIVTDFIGSGSRVCTLLEKFWKVPSVKAWMSRGWVDFKIVAAAGTSRGIEAVQSHRVRPTVLVEHIAPTIYDKGSRREAQWFSLISRYGPNPSSFAPTGFLDSGALVAFSYRIPNNVPDLLRVSANGWKALYDGPAPEDLRSAFGIEDPVDRMKNAASVIGIELSDNLSADEAELVVVLNAMGSRWFAGEENAIAEVTGLTVRQVALIRHDAVQNGLLRSDGRLTEVGQATRRAGIRSERKRPTIPTSVELYYPMQLRVPR